MMAPPRTASSEGVVLIPAATKRNTTGYKGVSFLEHLECGHQPHAQDRGAKKRTQLAGRSASGYGLESPSPGGARSQGHNTGLRGLALRSGVRAGGHRFQGGGHSRPTPPLACGEASGGVGTPP